MSESSSAPSGWYPDPQYQGTLRYWDGTVWTAHTAPGTTTATAQPAPASGRMHPGAIVAIVVGSIVVVSIIIMILAAIAIPVFLNQRQKADDAAARSDLLAISSLIAYAYVDDPNGPTSVTSDGASVEVATGTGVDGVQLSEGTEFGGYSTTPGTGMYCVWVDSASSEKSFQIDEASNAHEGSCGSY